jgi:hypothetical protein
MQTETGCGYHNVAGSVPDPRHFGTDPDPALFVFDFQDANNK